MVDDPVSVQPLLWFSDQQLGDEVLGLITHIIPNLGSKLPFTIFNGLKPLVLMRPKEGNVTREAVVHYYAEGPTVNFRAVRFLGDDFRGYLGTRLTDVLFGAADCFHEAATGGDAGHAEVDDLNHGV